MLFPTLHLHSECIIIKLFSYMYHIKKITCTFSVTVPEEPAEGHGPEIKLEKKSLFCMHEGDIWLYHSKNKIIWNYILTQFGGEIYDVEHKAHCFTSLGWLIS